MNRKQANKHYNKILKKARKEGTYKQAARALAQKDLFFLLTRICNRKDIDKDWLYDRCKDVQADSDSRLDLWFRDGYKSTIITFGMSILDILNNPDITIGIFSYKVSAAMDFLKQIKREFEQNKKLLELFPDILWSNPQREAPVWNETGIVVRRATNPKECTVEAHGVVDSQPTGKHFMLCVYDDVVTDKSVYTPEQIFKTTSAWEVSLNLASSQAPKRRYIGTRWDANDTYSTMIERGHVKPRIYPATVDGTVNGASVFLPEETLEEKRKAMSPYNFACQMLLDPKAGSQFAFKEEWLRFWTARHYKNLNIYIIVDPSSTKNKRSDYTAIFVIGYGSDGNYYVIDMVRDKLNAVEKRDMLFDLVRKYKPIKVGYEQYGMQSDIEVIKEKMNLENYRFCITPLGGKTKKEERIARLMVPFQENKIYLPDKCLRTNTDGVTENLTNIFIHTEYNKFPAVVKDDMLDALSRIFDMNMKAPAFLNRRKKATVAIMEY
jgi:predicted phage terminase large subunit-like protein